MPFVKLDCGILNSSLWIDKPARDIFVTALLLAEPEIYDSPIQQLEISNLKHTGWSAPPGWYGFVPAASTGLIDRAGVSQEEGTKALERLGSPDLSSRSSEHDGRRMIRINGGFIILNYNKYRERDYTNSERQKRWRDRNRNAVMDSNNAVTERYITQAEAYSTDNIGPRNSKWPTLQDVKAYSVNAGLPESEAEAFWNHFESVGWIDKNGHSILRWKNKLNNWKANYQSEVFNRNKANEINGRTHQRSAGRNDGTYNAGVASQYAKAAVSGMSDVSGVQNPLRPPT